MCEIVLQKTRKGMDIFRHVSFVHFDKNVVKEIS